MFDFWGFHKGLLNRTDYFDNYWEQFPSGQIIRYKREAFLLLEENMKNRDAEGLAVTLAIIYNDGADLDYTDLLLKLLDENWHTSEEDIVSILELIKDPKSIEKLYKVAINIPEYDEMRALAKKCMWALAAINTPESINKLELLKNHDDVIIKDNAKFQLEQIFNNS